MLLETIEKDIDELQKFIQSHPLYESYNYGKFFYKNDKSFKNFEHCNLILVKI